MGESMATCGRSRKLRNYIFIFTQEAEGSMGEENRKWNKEGEPANPTPLARLYVSKQPQQLAKYSNT